MRQEPSPHTLPIEELEADCQWLALLLTFDMSPYLKDRMEQRYAQLSAELADCHRMYHESAQPAQLR